MKLLRKITAGLISAAVILGSADISFLPDIVIAASAAADFDTVLTSSRVVVNGVVHFCDIGVLGDKWYITAKEAQQLFGTESDAEYVELGELSEREGIDYEQDTVLNAAYFNTWKRFIENDFDRAFTLSLVSEEWRDRADEQITSTEFRSMLVDLITAEAPDKLSYFNENVTAADMAMDRRNGFVMAFYAARCIGADYINDEYYISQLKDESIFTDGESLPTELFPNVLTMGTSYCDWLSKPVEEWINWEWDIGAASTWVTQHISPYSGNPIIDFDVENGSYHHLDALTVREACSVVARLYDSMDSNEMLALDDPWALTPDSRIITDRHLAYANSLPEVTGQDHPLWSAMLLDSFGASDGEILKSFKLVSNLGFNCIRVGMSNYTKIFSKDATKVNPYSLELIDQYIAMAIEYNVHLDLFILDWPGRWTVQNDDFTQDYELDLYVNPEHQRMTLDMVSLLTERYKDIPASVLSFTFLHEIDYSIGLVYEGKTITLEDASKYAGKLVNTIHEIDPDRLVFLDTPALELDDPPETLLREHIDLLDKYINDKTYTLMSYVYRLDNFVYSYMNIYEGTKKGYDANIDIIARGGFLDPYPTQFYVVTDIISPENELKFNGCLPAGTQFDFFVTESHKETFTATADGDEIYREDLEEVKYKTDPPIAYYHQYAKSDKKITFTLPADTDELVVSCTGEGVDLSGIDVYLPEGYEKEHWYSVTDYDVFIGVGEKAGLYKLNDTRICISPINDFPTPVTVTIHDDLTYSSDIPMGDAVDRKLIETDCDHLANVDGNCIIRDETAVYANVLWDAMYAYYDDLYSVYQEHNFSWISGDWFWIVHPAAYNIAGYPEVKYKEYDYFGLEHLKLYQKYQYLEHCFDNVKPTVTFDTGGAPAVAAQTLDFGGYAVRPSVPEKAGSYFVEWQLDGETYDFSTPVTSDITLKAVWRDFIYGDVNGDGDVTMADLLLMKQVMVKVPGKTMDMEAADVNCDGEVTMADLLRLKQYMVKVPGITLGK